MNSRSLTVPVVAAAIMLASCDGTNQKEQQTLMETSKQDLALALQERDQLLALVKEISAGIDEIRHVENLVALNASRQGDDSSSRNTILKDIEAIRKMMLKRRLRIQELETDLSNSTLNSSDLAETIEAFRIQIDTQLAEIEMLRTRLISANRHIDVLTNEVDSLTSTVTAVTNERDAAITASEQFENRLNTCYYIIASKSELKTHNIIESGFLRKTKLMKGDFDKGCFAAGDKRTLTTIPLTTAKARLLTNHPAPSYEIVDVEGQKILNITDPEQFWSLTNFLVVQTD